MQTNILRLPKNDQGRDFVIGDIHGAYDLLEQALAAVKFDPDKDRLISVGDLIDRGPQSVRCLEYLKQPWFYAVRGNHEDLFLQTVQDGVIDPASFAFNLRNGMGWIANETPERLREIERAFRALPLVIETETARGSVGFVHGDVPPYLDWQAFKDMIAAGDNDTIQTALWGRDRVNAGDDSGVDGIDRLFMGHTPQKNGSKRLGNCYYIDTGAVFALLLADTGAEYHLTIADIAGKTAPLSNGVPTKGDQIIIRTETDEKPFGKYGKKK